MKTKAKKTPTVHVSNCKFTNESFVVNESMALAVRALAEAAGENAKALYQAASRLTGPAHTAPMLQIGKND